MTKLVDFYHSDKKNDIKSFIKVRRWFSKVMDSDDNVMYFRVKLSNIKFEEFVNIKGKSHFYYLLNNLSTKAKDYKRGRRGVIRRIIGVVFPKVWSYHQIRVYSKYAKNKKYSKNKFFNARILEKIEDARKLLEVMSKENNILDQVVIPVNKKIIEMYSQLSLNERKVAMSELLLRLYLHALSRISTQTMRKFAISTFTPAYTFRTIYVASPPKKLRQKYKKNYGIRYKKVVEFLKYVFKRILAFYSKKEKKYVFKSAYLSVIEFDDKQDYGILDWDEAFRLYITKKRKYTIKSQFHITPTFFASVLVSYLTNYYDTDDYYGFIRKKIKPNEVYNIFLAWFLRNSKLTRTQKRILIEYLLGSKKEYTRIIQKSLPLYRWCVKNNIKTNNLDKIYRLIRYNRSIPARYYRDKNTKTNSKLLLTLDDFRKLKKIFSEAISNLENHQELTKVYDNTIAKIKSIIERDLTKREPEINDSKIILSKLHIFSNYKLFLSTEHDDIVYKCYNSLMNEYYKYLIHVILSKRSVKQHDEILRYSVLIWSKLQSALIPSILPPLKKEIYHYSINEITKNITTFSFSQQLYLFNRYSNVALLAKLLKFVHSNNVHGSNFHPYYFEIFEFKGPKNIYHLYEQLVKEKKWLLSQKWFRQLKGVINMAVKKNKHLFYFLYVFMVHLAGSKYLGVEDKTRFGIFGIFTTAIDMYLNHIWNFEKIDHEERKQVLKKLSKLTIFKFLAEINRSLINYVSSISENDKVITATTDTKYSIYSNYIRCFNNGLTFAFVPYRTVGYTLGREKFAEILYMYYHLKTSYSTSLLYYTSTQSEIVGMPGHLSMYINDDVYFKYLLQFYNFVAFRDYRRKFNTVEFLS